MTIVKRNYCIVLDEKTREKIDKYAKNHALSRSAVIRLAVNDFFLRGGAEI